MSDDPLFQVGDHVRKKGGDYDFPGIVVAAFRKYPPNRVHNLQEIEAIDRVPLGPWRYVVQDDRGTLFIQSDKTIELVDALLQPEKETT